MTSEHKALVELIQERMHRGKVKLSTGSITEIYLDMKHVLDTGERIHIALNAFADQLGAVLSPDDLLSYTAVGGPTMGADVISIPWVTVDPVLAWFSIREPKTTHGLGKTIEGADLGPGDSVILVDDVVSTGGSLLKAYNQVVLTGAKVTAVVPLVDRSGLAARPFANIGVPYHPVVTYKDLDIPGLAS